MPHGINRQKNLQFIFVSCRDTGCRSALPLGSSKKGNTNRAKYKIKALLFLFALPRFANSDRWFRDAVYLRAIAQRY